ncbi:hypothetical protein FQN54_003951 [Arachnomyces sp. PD_36]|nr:hypothetical protein FQN54_003951 [Arachnomyces sp. PD_36]
MGNQCIIDREKEDLAWTYCPSFGAAVAFAVFFGLATVAHIYQAFHYRKKFCWVIILSCSWETAGFAMRAVSAKEIYGLWHFIPQQLLIILAPIWLNAFVYMVMGRMILFLIPEQKIFGVSARRLTLIFVSLDIFSFLIQGSSSSLMSSDDDPELVKTGINIYMGGIGAQQLFILLFAVLAARFQREMTHLEATSTATTTPTVPWRRLLYTLYISLACITIRIIYRLVEYSGGMYTSIATSEAAFYCLEAVPMIIALVVFNVVHPGMVLVGEGSEFQKKSKEEKRAEKEEKRERKERRKEGKGKSRRRSHSRKRRDLEAGSDLEESEGFRMQDSLRR